jgi:hypothetical protein
MSTEKNQNQEIKIETNILKFPNCKENEQLEKSKERTCLLIQYCNKDGS